MIAALLTVLAWIAGSIAGGKNVTRVLFVISALLYLIAPVIIVRHIFGRSVVDGQTVLAAIAAYSADRDDVLPCVPLRLALSEVTPPFFGAQGLEAQARTCSSAS